MPLVHKCDACDNFLEEATGFEVIRSASAVDRSDRSADGESAQLYACSFKCFAKIAPATLVEKFSPEGKAARSGVPQESAAPRRKKKKG